MSTIGILTQFRNDAIVPKSLVPLGLAGFATALIFNFLVTALIIGRIWYEGRQRRLAMNSSGGIVSTRVQGYIKDSIDVVVESGMLYLIVQLIFTVLFAINHPAQIILSDIAVQIYVCLVFDLLLSFPGTHNIKIGYCTDSNHCPSWAWLYFWHSELF